MNLLHFHRPLPSTCRRLAVSALRLSKWRTVALPVAVIALLPVLSVLSAPAVHAASSTASLAIESLSTSVGVSSNAISGSSNSVSSRKAQVAQGEYRIREVLALAPGPDAAPAPAGPGATPPWRRTLDLEPLGADDPAMTAWRLTLPQQVAAAARLEPGTVLTVRQHPYGVSVSRKGEPQPFYLVLHDDWAEGLDARPVTP